MSRKTRLSSGTQFAPGLLGPAMTRRVFEMSEVSGTVKLPAVPALADHYFQLCSAIFRAVGRAFAPEEQAHARELLLLRLKEAYAGSPRSKIAIHYHAPAGSPLGYEICAEVRSLATAYDSWVTAGPEPLFGTHPDALVVRVAEELGPAAVTPVLDIGAGTGRNALALARRGHPVDAVELTPRFAELMAAEAEREGLAVRVIKQDVFQAQSELGHDYRLVILSEVVPDFRGTAQLRAMFELASLVLAPGGRLVLNLHLAVPGYTPDQAARQFGEQCYSALFTRAEVARASSGLPLELLLDESVYDYERAHLPAWPPTAWYENWIVGRDVYDLDRQECPVELRWLVYRKLEPTGEKPSLEPRGALSDPVPAAGSGGQARRRSLDPCRLREALLRRVKRRLVASGSITVPAVPGLRDQYLRICTETFGALGHELGPEKLAELRHELGLVLEQAHGSAAHSNLVITYQASMGSELEYTLSGEWFSVGEVYEHWLDHAPEPLFGREPDARVLQVAAELGAPAETRVLDLGAGTGRNALALARRGHPVDAVELVPRLAEILTTEARKENLSVRVIVGDLFGCAGALAQDYRLVIASGLLGDLRGLEELHRLLVLASGLLVRGGKLVASVHLAVPGYQPDRTVREWAEYCCATLFTRAEISLALKGLPLVWEADDSAYDYEQQHQPPEAWPPTASYPEWALGRHMFALERSRCPLELRWLVFGKTG